MGADNRNVDVCIGSEGQIASKTEVYMSIICKYRSGPELLCYLRNT